jgi:hypothetical protein
MSSFQSLLLHSLYVPTVMLVDFANTYDILSANEIVANTYYTVHITVLYCCWMKFIAAFVYAVNGLKLSIQSIKKNLLLVYHRNKTIGRWQDYQLSPELNMFDREIKQPLSATWWSAKRLCSLNGAQFCNLVSLLYYALRKVLLIRDIERYEFICVSHYNI